MKFARLATCLVALSAGAAAAADILFETPSDDRWHYPFNFTPGSRGQASIFGAVFENFNDRDACVILAWDTSELIPAGQGAEAYEIEAIHVTITNQANAFVGPAWAPDTTVDEWYTYDANGDGLLNADGVDRGEPGDTDGESDDSDPCRPIERCGAAFEPYGLDDESTWTESSFFFGGNGDGDIPRNPYPFVHDEFGHRLHTEDSIKGLHNDALGVFQYTPTPWAIGVPHGYTPGAQSTPFDIHFDVDLSLESDQVRAYFQNQLDRGRVIVMITSLKETDLEGTADGFPSIYMKEGLIDPGARPASLTVTLTQCEAPGDVNGDSLVDLLDASAFVDVALGVNQVPGARQRADVNCDGAVDGLDIPALVDLIL